MLSEGFVTESSVIARCNTDRPVRALSFSNDGRMIAVGGDHAIVWLFGLNNRNRPRYSATDEGELHEHSEAEGQVPSEQDEPDDDSPDTTGWVDGGDDGISE